MKTTIRILIGLLLTALGACQNPSTQKDSAALDKKSRDTYIPNLSFINGKYLIDTSAILINHNLKSLLEEVEKADLVENRTVSGIPVFIKSFLDSLTGNFSIANPGEDWQVGCCVLGKQIQKRVYDKKKGDTLLEVSFDESQPLPSRQLIYLGLGKDIALMAYHTGGWGKSEHIIITKFDDSKIVDFWCGSILTDLTTKTEILKYLNSNRNKHWGLNTNMIYL